MNEYVIILPGPSVISLNHSEISSNLYQLEECCFVHLGARISSAAYPRSRLLSVACSLFLMNKHLLLAVIPGLVDKVIKHSPYTVPWDQPGTICHPY